MILGAGAVAASLVEAYRAGFPGIEVAIWNRTPERARDAGRRRPAPRRSSDLAAAVAAADIVATATMATRRRCCGANGCGPASIST